MLGEFIPLPSESVPAKHARVIRGPSQIAFDITNRCNFRCRHCFNRSGSNAVVQRELSDAEVLDFIDDVTETKPFNFCFCGGEPLLREQVLLRAARTLAGNSIMVSMVTNGYLMTSEKAHRLKDNGVARVQVSLDGATQKAHEFLRPYNGAFERAVTAIRILGGVSFADISVAYCPTSANCMELSEAYAFCRDLGVTTFRVQPLMSLGNAQNNPEIVPSAADYRDLVRSLYLLKSAGFPKPSIEWGDPIDHLIRFRTLADQCVNFASIRADGAIQPSPYIPLSVGNVTRHRFSEYWHAGLPRLWQSPRVKEVAERVRAVPDMGRRHSDMPTVWYEENIELDLIDDDFFSLGESSDA